ncbi:MAG: hypothetical protein V2I32_11520 [Desulforhopalus sp.]|jgi:hypothetical protein|nr:hypothetical protein [Desulforhopalus sp.]
MYLSSEQHRFPHLQTIPHRVHTVETLLEQGSTSPNEDVLLENDGLYGVFDGATSLDAARYCGGLTGGLLAARIAADTFSEENGSLKYRAGKANGRIRDTLLAENIPLNDRHRLWSTSLAVVRLADDRFEYCQSGDAMILLITDDDYRLVTPEIDIDRETLQLWKDVPQFSQGTIYHHLAEQIHRVRLQMNVSYGVLNGEPQALDFIHHGYQTLDGIRDILLFTDGLNPPRENPGNGNDWQSLVNLYRCGGLPAVRNHVRHLQQTDPTCRKYPRFKQHDDIAAVAIKL